MKPGPDARAHVFLLADSVVSIIGSLHIGIDRQVDVLLNLASGW